VGAPKIFLQPVGLDDVSLLGEICEAVENAFGFSSTIRPPSIIPRQAFSASRGQYHSTTILKALNANPPADALKILGITDADLYVPELNFVFGEAAIDGLVCVISLCRLRPEYYGSPSDRRLFAERAIKEAIHELGHTFGLRHASDRKSVMHFSNTIQDTDRKSAEFTRDESERLRGRLTVLERAA